MNRSLPAYCVSLALLCSACVEDFPVPADAADTAQPVDTALPEDTTPPIDSDGISDAESPEDTTPPEDTARRADEQAPAWGDEAALNVLDLGEDHLTLTWSWATDESGLTSYHVFQDDVLVTKLDPNNQSLQVNQLNPSQAYTYRIEAEDTLGNISSAGPSVTVTTGDETEPVWGDDSTINSSDVTAESLMLTWSGASDNVAVSAYRVYRDNIEIGTTEGETTSYGVTGLLGWHSYTFRVEAEDAHGNISFGGPTVTAQTADDSAPTWEAQPELLASQMTSTSCYLGWDPAQDDVGVTAYQVLQDNVEVALLDGNTTWTKVEGLSPWTLYTFEVHAWDEAGNMTAVALEVSVFTPDEAAPSWDEGSVLLASNATDTTVTLGWTAASDDVGVTDYHVYQDNVQIAVVDGQTLSDDVGGLDDSLTYVFRIEAADSSGNMSFGGPAMLLDLSDKTPPQWPNGATATATEVHPTWASLSWSEATDNIAIGGYQVMESGDVIASVGADETSATVTGLTHLTSYILTIVATDASGNASDSGPSVSVSTPDFVAPSWPQDASITPSGITSDSLVLAWSAVGDGIEVVSYELYQDDVMIMTVDAPGMTATVSGLSPLTSYGFRVEAVGPTGKVSDEGPAVDVTTLDLAAPIWADNAALTTADVSETSLTLNWPALHDSQNVTSYQVSQDDVLIDAVDAPWVSSAVVGLSLGVSYAFKVEAVGPTGQVSDNGPSTTVSTSDSTGPTWSANAVLNADSVSDTGVTLSWTAATDNIAVSGYEIFLDGNAIGSVAGDVTTYDVTGLTLNTAYDLQVQATDGAGNATVDGPSLQVTTAGGQASLTNQEVFDGLNTDCTACHSAQASKPYFGSLGSFNSMLVDDVTLVTPGDPDASELIHLLEGNGSGLFMQMPLSGDSFKALSDQGNTDITIEQIRDWVTAMQGGGG